MALVCLLLRPAVAQSDAAAPWWSAATEQALAQAGTNRVALTAALAEAPPAHRPGVQFLIENMPPRDLTNLTAAFVLENTALAYEALEQAPWRDRIAPDLFLNDILPYACASERRDPWRKDLRARCLPLIQGCDTPGAAARRLNEQLFGLVKVKYSTQRRRADQSPVETMESGLASCTGLSILLVGACRSVGVPARLAGIPNWVDKRGNHTWAEVWDDGWHFLGAAEPDAAGLDRGWFAHDASLARKDVPEHAIYATSFRRTGLVFPMVWARRANDVSAVNVTDRYTAGAKPADPAKVRLRVKVLDRAGGQRVSAAVLVVDPADPALRFEGTSRDERSDANDFLTFELPRDRAVRVDVSRNGRRIQKEIQTGREPTLLLVVPLEAASPGSASASGEGRGAPASPLEPGLAAALTDACAGFFRASAEAQTEWAFAAPLEAALRTNEAAVRRVVWDAFRAAPLHEALRNDHASNQVRFEEHLSPYVVKTVGERPPGGWPLFIAMHGGGNAPKEVNDRQWRVMQTYYRDQPEVGGYRYLALRAPNDTWNGFYADYVYPLVANLIRQFVLFADVDPNRVFAMGYSHGGYGAFAIGPKMPDRFAAVHASAAAPTDGETSAKTLRTLPFSFMIGENDRAYGRIDRCRSFDTTLRGLRGERTDIYPAVMELKAGAGHSGLPDREKIKDLYAAVRQPVPREVSWEMTDSVIRYFYWLHVPQPAKGQEVTAICEDNRVRLETQKVASVTVLLDGRLVDLTRPVTLEVNGRTSTIQAQPRLATLCQTMLERGDPDLAFSATLAVTP